MWERRATVSPPPRSSSASSTSPSSAAIALSTAFSRSRVLTVRSFSPPRVSSHAAHVTNSRARASFRVFLALPSSSPRSAAAVRVSLCRSPKCVTLLPWTRRSIAHASSRLPKPLIARAFACAACSAKGEPGPVTRAARVSTSANAASASVYLRRWCNSRPRSKALRSESCASRPRVAHRPS